MARHKTAIAIPKDLLDEIDAAARAHDESRRAFITRIMRVAMSARQDREITKRLDALFADEAVLAEQLAPTELAEERLGDERW